MTDGRFESTCDNRPGGWDSRRHWTKTHAPFASDPEHIRDHMERESCPFHDLRADGCFQPEYAGIGIEGTVTRPDELVRRKAGNRMATAAGVAQGAGRGVGGIPIALDTEPPHPVPLPPAPGGHRPWKASGKTAAGFGGFPHMSEPEPEPVRGVAPRGFATSRVPVIGAPAKHHPEPYVDPKPYGRKPFRLASGVARRKDVIGPAPPCPPPEKPARRAAASAQRPPMQSAKSVQGTFSHYPRNIPDPVPTPKIRTGKWALFTYWAKTKRAMPVEVPFRAGTQAAEAPKLPADTTKALAMTTGNVTMRGRPRVGEQSLLRIK